MPTTGLRRLIFDAQDRLCAYCGCGLTFEDATIDHVIPRSRGGRDGYENLVVACEPCNTAKGDDDPTELQRMIAKLVRRKVGDAMVRVKQRYRIIEKYKNM